jgi:hypothetical protein
LLNVVRKYDRVWQTTPIIENRLKALLYFTLTSGRLFGKPLKTSCAVRDGNDLRRQTHQSCFLVLQSYSTANCWTEDCISSAGYEISGCGLMA